MFILCKICFQNDKKNIYNKFLLEPVHSKNQMLFQRLFQMYYFRHISKIHFKCLFLQQRILSLKVVIENNADKNFKNINLNILSQDIFSSSFRNKVVSYFPFIEKIPSFQEEEKKPLYFSENFLPTHITIKKGNF